MMTHKKNSWVIFASVAAAMTFSKLAVAGNYTNDLTKCLITSATPADKSILVRWMFATVALHPDIGTLSAVTPSQRAELNSNTARLFERIVTETCKTQTQAAVRNEGPAALQASFRSFGEAATRELVTNQKVAAGLSNTASNLDPIKLMEILQ